MTNADRLDELRIVYLPVTRLNASLGRPVAKTALDRGLRWSRERFVHWF